MPDFADLTDRASALVQDALARRCLVCKAKPGNDCTSMAATTGQSNPGGPLPGGRIVLTPHSRAEYLAGCDVDLEDLDDIEIARLVWVMLSQGRSGTLRKTGWRTYINPAGSSKGMPGYLDAYVDRMAAAAERLHHVSLECRPALEIIEQYGQHPAVCLYVDPPYLGATRSGSGNGYRLEMRDPADHAAVLDALLACRASVVLSGYASDLYDDTLSSWDRIEFSTRTSQGTRSDRTSSLRTEIIWSNRTISSQCEFDFCEAGA